MGSTIRRQPLSFKIPASPDYQFLNVLNFNGLNMTDNPFNADVTTASDCLNVYVDEANALTTRPRLELFYDLHKKHPGMTKLLGVYPLSIGYLFHYTENGSYALDIAYDVANTLTFVNVDTSTHGVNPKVDKLSVFEQNDKIYILSGEGYYFITYTTIDDTIIRAEIDVVDGYIPTTRVGKNKQSYDEETDTYKIDVGGVRFEDVNLLSDKYKESYFWDGVSEIPQDATGINVENNYYSNELANALEKTHDIWMYYPDDKLFVMKNKTTKYLSIGSLKENGDVDIHETYLDLSYQEFLPYFSTKNKRIVTDYSATQKMVIDIISGEKYTTRLITVDSSEVVSISPDGKYLLTQDFDLSYIYKITDSTVEKITINGLLDGHALSKIVWSDDGKTALISSYSTDGSSDAGIYLITDFDTTNTAKLLKITSTVFHPNNISLSGDGATGALCDDSRGVEIFTNLLTEPMFVNKTYDSIIRTVLISNDGKTAWLQSETNNIFVDFRFSTKTKNVASLNIDIGSPLVIIPGGIAFGSKTFYEYVYSDEPQWVVTKQLTSLDDVYEAHKKRRDAFLQSLLTTRFNNERWFASGNRLYYTSYNDPTYIGLYNYTDLGESDENITGFNLADDSTLIVYKDNRVHSVRYGEAGENVYTYIYSDSPNTIGNNAIGGSIVSILTEIPLQISYDGIYALRQLTNVQSSGRISELISEGINKKWLTENKEAIRNCKTINRLYWTYFILSEKDYSKIYLLDNRTQSWYYWELPISILNAFVKNNTTYFSDIDGNLYTLKTTDLFNKFNPEITEYYDEGKKLIKWNWKSQILPMKTINYSKKLVSTTFIMSDTDEKDEYGLNYKFKAFRKTASQTQETTLTNNINYIVSTTKRTLVPRFNFMQIELSNIEGTSDDFDHNKLRLIGMAFKYVLLEGLI